MLCLRVLTCSAMGMGSGTSQPLSITCIVMRSLPTERERQQLFPGEFVLHSLRHTMLTRLRESSVDAFTIMKIAGHSSIVVSQRYVHPTPEAVESAFESLQRAAQRGKADTEIGDVPMQAPATLPVTSDAAIFVSN
jgi:hypothetical protein